ncbi:hypothetical protein TNCV_4303911 [Trichonephila clavipes]|nr:hypothetical protein TNCV_4303911 [Trichonephila clavipes]
MRGAIPHSRSSHMVQCRLIDSRHQRERDRERTISRAHDSAEKCRQGIRDHDHSATMVTRNANESGRGSLVAKVTDSWLAYFEFEPVPLKTRCAEEPIYIKFIEAQTFSSWGDVEVRRGGQGCHPLSLTIAQNPEVRRQKSSSSLIERR